MLGDKKKKRVYKCMGGQKGVDKFLDGQKETNKCWLDKKK